MTITRDPRGNLVRLGRIEHKFEYDPSLGDALPSWLAVAVGTGSVASWTGGGTPAYYRVTAASASIGAAGRIRVSPAIRADQYEEIELKLEGFRWDTANGWSARIEIGNDNQDRGVSLRQDNSSNADARAIIRAHNGGAAVDFTTGWQLQQQSGGSTRPRSFSLILRPRTKEVILLEADQVMAAVQMGATDSSLATTVNPQITFANVDAVQHWCSFAKLSVIVRSNA